MLPPQSTFQKVRSKRCRMLGLTLTLLKTYMRILPRSICFKQPKQKETWREPCTEKRTRRSKLSMPCWHISLMHAATALEKMCLHNGMATVYTSPEKTFSAGSHALLCWALERKVSTGLWCTGGWGDRHTWFWNISGMQEQHKYLLLLQCVKHFPTPQIKVKEILIW